MQTLVPDVERTEVIGDEETFEARLDALINDASALEAALKTVGEEIARLRSEMRTKNPAVGQADPDQDEIDAAKKQWNDPMPSAVVASRPLQPLSSTDALRTMPLTELALSEDTQQALWETFGMLGVRQLASKTEESLQHRGVPATMIDEIKVELAKKGLSLSSRQLPQAA